MLIVAVLAVSLAAICFAMASLSIGTGTWSFFPSTPIVAGVLTKRGLDECINLLNTKAAYKFVPSIAFTVLNMVLHDLQVNIFVFSDLTVAFFIFSASFLAHSFHL